MKVEWTNKDSLDSGETTKAILVVDMPNECDGCPLTYIDYGDDAYYGANTTRCVIDKDEIPIHGKWDECPLKQMPKENDIYEVGMDEEDTNAKRQWNKGWNACLKEIENESNISD